MTAVVGDARLRIRVPALAATAGYVDAVTFIVLFSLFTAHLTGDTTHLAVDVGRDSYGGDALARIVVIVVFVVAVALGTAVIGSTVRSEHARRRLLVVEAALLTVLMLAGSYWIDRGELSKGSAAAVLLAACAAGAMGLQNVVVRSAAGTGVNTTFLTGMLTAFAEDVVAALRDRTDAEVRRRARLHGGMWVAFLGGGVIGAAAVTQWDLWALAAPVAVVVTVAAADRSTTQPSAPAGD